MNWTIKAILARFKGDQKAAYDYCVRVCKETKNMGVVNEYFDLAMHFKEEMQHEQLQRTRTVLASGCCA